MCISRHEKPHGPAPARGEAEAVGLASRRRRPRRALRHVGARYAFRAVAAPVIEAQITCPHCGFAKVETMPTNACQHVYRCGACGATLRPLPGDCCVFCSYADSVCPPQQSAGTNERRRSLFRGAKRAIRAVRVLARDGRIPRPLRWLALIGLLPIPGPVDEGVLLLVALLLWAFYRERLIEAWRLADESAPVRAASRPTKSAGVDDDPHTSARHPA